MTVQSMNKLSRKMPQCKMINEIIEKIKKLTPMRVGTVCKHVQEMHEKFPLLRPALKKILVYLERKSKEGKKKPGMTFEEEELMSLVKEFSSAAFKALQFPEFLKIMGECAEEKEKESTLPEAALKALKKSNAKDSAPQLLKMIEKDELFSACVEWSRSENSCLHNSKEDKNPEDEDVEIPESDPHNIHAVNNGIDQHSQPEAATEKSNKVDVDKRAPKQPVIKNYFSKSDKEKPKSLNRSRVRQRSTEYSPKKNERPTECSPKKKVPRSRSPSIILCYDDTTNKMRKAKELIKGCKVRLVDIKPLKSEPIEIENNADQVTEILTDNDFQQNEQEIKKNDSFEIEGHTEDVLQPFVTKEAEQEMEQDSKEDESFVTENDADKITESVTDEDDFKQKEQEIKNNLKTKTSVDVVVKNGKNRKPRSEDAARYKRSKLGYECLSCDAVFTSRYRVIKHLKEHEIDHF